MKIPIQQLLEKMEIELQLAKQTSDELIIREKLAIIRAMCDLALMQPTEKIEKPSIKNTVVEAEDEKINSEGSLFDF